jgi:hypothetical protein
MANATVAALKKQLTIANEKIAELTAAAKPAVAGESAAA